MTLSKKRKQHAPSADASATACLSYDLVSVNALEDFKLAVVFSDGKRGVFDCGPYMNFEFMEELRDPEKFAKVFIENGTASWSFDGADLAPDDIYQNCKPYGLSISAQKSVRPGERRAQLVT